MKTRVAFFDAKTYDREFFGTGTEEDSPDWHFLEFRLVAETARMVQGYRAVCVFVNDQLDEPCLRILADAGVGMAALRCAGFNNVDLRAARRLGIRVTRVPAYSPHSVAEHTVALLLTLNRKIHRAYNRVREHNFSLGGLVGFDLFGKTIGIVGTGKIGKVTAEIFRGFGCRVLAHDPFPDPAWASLHGIEYALFDDLLSQCDVVSLHLPLTAETDRIINEERIQKMKPGAYLINTGRGKLISTGALIQALKSRHLGGVALDVYEEEEGVFFEDLSGTVLEDDELARLLTFPNVLVTSHQAFLTREALSEIARVTTENIRLFGAGRPPLPGTELA